MRWMIALAALILAGCVSTTGVNSALTPADAPTALLSGGPLTMRIATSAASGDDPLNVLTLVRSDGRAMVFEEANHAPNDVRAQAVGGPLAQAMGLFGEEQPVLYHVREGGHGAAFICAPEGPMNIGVYTAPDGQVSIVGLKSGFEFEERGDGTASALPFSPDHVCARMHFRKS